MQASRLRIKRNLENVKEVGEEKDKCKLGIRDLVIFQLESHRRCCKQFNRDPSNTIFILSPNHVALQDFNAKNLLLTEIMLNFWFEP